jgi:hypothetical protein
MEFLKLLGLFGLLTLDAALMEFSWLGYALRRDYRNDGLSFDRLLAWLRRRFLEFER